MINVQRAAARPSAGIPPWVVVLAANLICVAYLWSYLGFDYTPVNDGWVGVVNFDGQQDRAGPLELADLSNERMVRSVPFRIWGKAGSNDFSVLIAQLMLVNVFTGLGLYLIISRFVSNRLYCAAASLLMMYYPFDGTMFWIGAFGVNFGFVLAIYSLVLLFRSIETRSIALYLPGLALLLASGRTYPGYLPLLASVLVLFLWIRRQEWRTWLGKAIVYWAVFFALLASFAKNAVTGSGREGSVAEFDVAGVLDGFAFAFQHAYVESVRRLFEVEVVSGGVVVAAIGVAAVLVYLGVTSHQDGNDAGQESSERQFRKVVLVLAVVAPLLLMAGYAPYAFTDIRIGTNRQMLFARLSVVMFYMAIIFWLVGAMIRNRARAALLTAVVSAVLLGMSLEAKSVLAKEYADASEVERIFLGDLAEAAPSFVGDPYILLYLEDDVVVNDKAVMLINRPQYLLSYLYGKRRMQVKAMTRYLWVKNDVQVVGDDLVIRNLRIKKDSVLALRYGLRSGLQVIDQLDVPAGRKYPGMTVEFSGQRYIDNRQPLSERQQWYVDERDRLVRARGIERP